MIKPSVASKDGRIVKFTGDGFLSEFGTVQAALECAIDMQKQLSDNPLEFRMAINLGDIIDDGRDIHGEGINIAARLEGIAEPGGICISGDVYNQVRNRVNAEYEDLGLQEVKSVAEPVQAYAVQFENIDEASDQVASPVTTEKPSIAVLPFDNMSGDPEQEYFADGISEDIITNLSLWRTFPVISRNSSFTYRGQSHNLKQVSQELGARYIVEGSVRKGGNRVRITAQLIDTDEDHHLWSERWDRTLEDIFDVQDEVSEAIARRVAPSVTGHEQKRLTRKRPENLSAWEEYLQGLRCYYERPRTDYEDPGLTQARIHFENAIELDPTLSDAHAYLSIFGASHLTQRISKDSEKTLDEMLFHGRKAEALNPENPLSLLGISIAHFFRGNHPAVLDYAQRAVKLNPSLAMSHFWLGLGEVHSGEYQKGERSIRKAFELSPADPDLMHFQGVLYFAYLGQGKYEEALEAIDKALLRHPDVGHHLGFRAAVLGHLERSSDANAALKRYLALRPDLKIRDDYRRIFVPNSSLVDTIIEGLIKSGWKPEG